MCSTKTVIPLFWPHIYKEETLKELKDTLETRWVGHGPKTELIEKKFAEYIGSPYAVAVNCCTSALHLAYIMAGIGEGDEVITPVFTCSATQTPLLYQGAIPVFADIKDDMTIDPEDVKKKITKRTKAIVAVDMGGKRCDYKALKKFGLPIIADMAQSMFYNPEATYSCYSLQAIKFATSGDGGFLTMHKLDDYKRARRLAWYGIDRKKAKKLKNSRDINFLRASEVGYKYEMNDIAACLGLVGLKHVDEDIKYRRELVKLYNQLLKKVKSIEIIDNKDSSIWLYMIMVKNRKGFFQEMDRAGIEVHMSHVRNDNMDIFKKYKNSCSNMDRIENHYICLPLNSKITKKDIRYICKTIKNIYE